MNKIYVVSALALALVSALNSTTAWSEEQPAAQPKNVHVYASLCESVKFDPSTNRPFGTFRNQLAGTFPLTHSEINISNQNGSLRGTIRVRDQAMLADLRFTPISGGPGVRGLVRGSSQGSLTSKSGDCSSLEDVGHYVLQISVEGN
jgi:hypothetical protein